MYIPDIFAISPVIHHDIRHDRYLHSWVHFSDLYIFRTFCLHMHLTYLHIGDTVIIRDMGDIAFSDRHLTQAQAEARVSMARTYVRRALAAASPAAIKFQRRLLDDETLDPALRFKVSESILDRFMGKATQAVDVRMVEPRPLNFDPKLQSLRRAFDAAEDAVTKGENPLVAFSAEATRGMGGLIDGDGVAIPDSGLVIQED